MKIRSGFVSNSSSSSFVLLAPKDKFNEALNQVHPYIAFISNTFAPKNSNTLLGKEFVLLSGTLYSEDGPNLYGYKGDILDDAGKVIAKSMEEIEDSDSYYELMTEATALNIMSNKLKELSQDVIYNTYSE
jgi:hypothetical protein